MNALPQLIADDIAFHLDAIAAHFKAPKITLLVRPTVPKCLDADCVLTNDELPLAILALERRHALGPDSAIAGEILPPESACPPFPGPLVIAEGPFGHDAYFPHPNGAVSLVPFREGLQLGWTHFDGARVAIAIWIGEDGEFGVGAALTFGGLDKMIADLQSIRAQVAG